MPDPQSKAAQAGDGFAALQKVVADSDAKNKKAAKKPETPPPAPPIQTDSMMGLLTSLKDRAKYAIFGPSTSSDAKTAEK